MGLLAPLALLGLLAVPVIVAFYMLRLRRREQVVSSTFLWQQLVRDVEANAPWQRLRRSLLLLLQLLLAVVLAFVVAQPITERPAGLARDLVLVIDASASMAATDVFPDRLTAAKRAAQDALRDLPSDGRVSVVVAAETARVVANEARDRGRIQRAIESIAQTTGPGDMDDALKLAGKLAERARGAGILVVTDDAGSEPPDVEIPVPIQVIAVGTQRDNQAVSALAVRSDPSGLKRTVFVSVGNYSASRVVRRLRILADGTPVSARDLALEPLSRADVVIDELPPGTRIVEARLAAPDGVADDTTGPADLLALDDAAWTIVPPDELQHILLVGPGNVYLQNALSLLPNVELYGATAEEYPGTTGKEHFDLFVFDGYLPDELPDKPILAIAPPRTSPLGAVTGTLEQPAVGQLPSDDPLLRNVDLSRVHVAEAKRIALPSWARAVIPSAGDAPLLYSGLRAGLPSAVIGFDLRQSDLPLQVAWPILISNLAGELLGLDPTATDPLGPAAPIELPLRPGVTGLRVTLPDGSVRDLAPSATGASSVTFVETRQLGVYRAEEVGPASADGSTASPTASPSPRATPSGAGTAEASPGTEAGASPLAPPGDDPEGPILFAVDLFAPDESNIAAGDGERLAALGEDATGGGVAAGVSRDDWWPLLVAVALALLLIEWLVYERDGARRILKTVRTSLGPLRPRRAGR